MQRYSSKILFVFSLSLVLALILAACGPQEEIPISTVVSNTATSTAVVEPTPTPVPPPTVLNICAGKEPLTLYPFGSLSMAAHSVLSIVYDGPIDYVDYEYQPVVLTKLPSLEDGDASIESISVVSGDEVIDADGNLTVLDDGVRVHPSGCYTGDCIIEYDGESELQMDQMVVQFSMRTDLVWSDGTLVTASDSAYGYYLDFESSAPGMQFLMDRTDYYDAVDEYSTEWWGKPGYIDDTYFTNFWQPAPEHIWGEFNPEDLPSVDVSSRTPLGWGPYVIDAWIPGQSIQLIQNPFYRGLLAFETIVFRFVESPDDAISQLVDGSCDILDPSIVLDGQIGILEEFQKSGQLQLYVANQPTIEKLEFGISTTVSGSPNILSDVRTRRALALCLDRQQVVDTVLFGEALIPNTYLSPEDPLYNPAAETYAFNISAAAALFDEIGWADHDSDPTTPRQAQNIPNIPNGTPLTLEYATTSALQRREASEILAGSLSECGVQVNLVYLSPEEFYAEGPDGLLFGRRFDLVQYAMGGLGTVSSCGWYMSDSIPTKDNNWIGTNLAGYESDAYDLACQNALNALPGNLDYYDRHLDVQMFFAQDLPYVPLYTRLRAAASRPDLCSYKLDPISSAVFWNIENLSIEEGCAVP